MAHERKQADTEAGRTMRHWGWFAYAVRDATICPRCKYVVWPGAEAGAWDFVKVGVPIWEQRRVIFIDVEVKAGDTSLPFNALRPEQRQWAKDNSERPKWLWICLGRRVGSNKYPRRTVFMPYETFLEIEQSLMRKSIPYAYPGLAQWDLEWLGHSLWDAPETHPLRTKYHWLEQKMQDQLLSTVRGNYGQNNLMS